MKNIDSIFRIVKNSQSYISLSMIDFILENNLPIDDKVIKYYQINTFFILPNGDSLIFGLLHKKYNDLVCFSDFGITLNDPLVMELFNKNKTIFNGYLEEYDITEYNGELFIHIFKGDNLSKKFIKLVQCILSIYTISSLHKQGLLKI